MREHLNITSAPMLENLIEMTFPSGNRIDLHNDFSSERIEYRSGKLVLRFNATHTDAGFQHVTVEFFDATFDRLLIAGNLYEETLGLGTLERVKCEVGDELLPTFPDGRVAFLTEFFPSGSFEIRASKVTVIAE